MSHDQQRDFVAVTYDAEKCPYTEYPDRLARYLVTRYGLQHNQKILDLGCGRGEFLQGFIRCGIEGYGVDQSLLAETTCPEARLSQSDIERDPLPYDDNTFDCVFSKSVLEHFYYPEKLVAEIFRIVRPGGTVITMVPDWESQYRCSFYADYTHRTPFTVQSLHDILAVGGFDDIQVDKFYQLPLLWNHPSLKPFFVIMGLISFRWLRSRIKFVRFSKELMLLSSATKLL